ncbi:MAG TPA: VOC family protein [Bryobacteraceae bacterium]|jgi:PhnB protein|nr:VOC family protein [Bryobacteraceae bacterium]
MQSHVQPIPKGFHAVTPYMVVNDAAKAIDFYKRAFDATEITRMEAPGGKIGHAEIQIGDSIVMLAEEMPQMDTKSPQTLGGTTCGIFLYVGDVDAVFQKAVSAGAKSTMPVADMFWGDRYGKVTDPFGHSWSLATRKEEVSPAELHKRIQAGMAQQQSGQKTRTAT